MSLINHEKVWLNVANDPKRDEHSFLSSFSQTFLKADPENRAHLFMASLCFIHKYKLVEQYKEPQPQTLFDECT